MLGAVEQRLEHVRGEVAVDRGDARFRHPAHQLLAAAAVADEIGDRDDHEVVLGREPLEVGEARHRAVVVDDLGEHARRLEAGEAGEVDRGLGVAGPVEHAALAVAQREDVAGTGEVFGAGRGVEDGLHRGAAVGGGDAGGRAVAGVDRDRERGALRLGVVGHHQRDPQLVEPAALDRHADHAARVADHERHGLGRHLLGRDDEVALVLTVGVVDHDHDLAACDGVDGLLDLCERHVGFLSLLLCPVNVPRTWPRCRLRGSRCRRRCFVPSVVTARVCGITATANPSGDNAATVRLMPSTVIDPFSTT